MNEVKIQLCCGENRLPGWQNYDSDLDVSKSLPFPDNHADMIFMEHALEHFDSHTIFRIMFECHKILKPGGVLRICVPILGRIESREKCIDLILNHGHKFLFDFESLVNMLFAAGFDTHKDGKKSIVETGRSEIDGHWKVIGRELDDLETLRVQATK